MALAIIGGSYRQFAPFADLYRRAAAQFGHDAGTLKLSINSPGLLAATHREAIEISHPYFQSGWMANHHQRGQGVPMPLTAYEAQSTRAGAFFLGSPQEVTNKILDQWELVHHDRVTIQLGLGNVAQRAHPRPRCRRRARATRRAHRGGDTRDRVGGPADRGDAGIPRFLLRAVQALLRLRRPVRAGGQAGAARRRQPHPAAAAS
jgi:hypothetical protein